MRTSEVEAGRLRKSCFPRYGRCWRISAAEQAASGQVVLENLRQCGGRRISATVCGATCPPGHHRQLHGHPTGRLHAATKGCLAGTGAGFVLHRGEVFPCGYLPVSAGNIRQQRFTEIWQGSPLFAELRDPDLLTGKCGVCQFKALCSGCRARAYGMTGDYLAEEPFCACDPQSRSSARQSCLTHFARAQRPPPYFTPGLACVILRTKSAPHPRLSARWP
jgi:radical SAM protein with 4Fe4S-binding SPASM domain